MTPQRLISWLIASCLYVLFCPFDAAPLLASPAAKTGMPKRIVSLTLASDEWLTALLPRQRFEKDVLGLSLVAKDSRHTKLTAAHIKGKTLVSAHLEPILALKPDLVIVAPYNNPSFLKKLKHMRVQQLNLNTPETFQDLWQNLQRLGAAVGATNEAKELEKRLRSRLAAIQSRHQKQKSSKQPPRPPSVLVYGQGGYAVASHTLIDAILRAAGAVNALSLGKKPLRGWQKLDPEFIASLNPDFVLAARSTPSEEPKLLDSLRKQPGWASLAAVKHPSRVIFVERQSLMSLSHYALDAVDELSNLLDKLQQQAASLQHNALPTD